MSIGKYLLLTNKYNRRYLLNAFVIGLVYLVAAKLGLSLAEGTKQVTIIWPPTGIALVAIFLFGYRYWPAISLGAFLANILTQEPFAVAVCITIGNTLEAIAGVYLLRRLIGFDGNLNTIKKVLGLIFLAAMASTLLSATIGTSSLAIGGIIEWHKYLSVWSIWWMGDMMADLILAPFLFVVASGKFIRSFVQARLEWIAIITLSLTSSLLVFTAHSGGALAKFSLAYLAFPFIIWAALRFAEVGAMTMTLFITIVATWGTGNNLGPFVDGSSIEKDLIFLYFFMGVVAITSMLMGAVVAERSQSRQDLIEYSQALARAKSRLVQSIVRRKASEDKRDQFVSMASHELKTPITSAIVFAEILQRQLQKTNNDKLAVQYLSRLSQSLDRLTKLTTDLIDVTRSRTGKLRLQKEPFRIDKLVELVVSDLQLITQNTLLIRGHVRRLVKADEIRIRQVLINLITNAIKYSPKDKEIIVSLELNRGFVVVKVQDFGQGVPKTEQTKIFEPFYQRSNVIKLQAGLGLGLHIASQIVELHNGKIWIESQPHKGSTFAFSLPLAKRSRAVKSHKTR